MKNLIWLAFDLGVQGDYEGIYGWLDERQAKECGDGLACLQFSFTGDLTAALQKDLKGRVKITPTARIYAIWSDAGRMKGRFIVGKRRAAPWTGFGALALQEEDSDA